MHSREKERINREYCRIFFIACTKILSSPSYFSIIWFHLFIYVYILVHFFIRRQACNLFYAFKFLLCMYISRFRILLIGYSNVIYERLFRYVLRTVIYDLRLLEAIFKLLFKAVSPLYTFYALCDIIEFSSSKILLYWNKLISNNISLLIRQFWKL